MSWIENKSNRKLVWELLTESTSNLPISHSDVASKKLPSTAMNFLHSYFMKSGQLNISQFRIAILATFVASKTQECFVKIDCLAASFIGAAYSLNETQLDYFGISKDYLDHIKNQSSESYDDFRKDLIESELDFMTAMEWDFPCYPFEKIYEWEPIIEQNFSALPEVFRRAEGFLTTLILNPDCPGIPIEDIAASALQRAFDLCDPNHELPDWKSLDSIKYEPTDKFNELYQQCR